MYKYKNTNKGNAYLLFITAIAIVSIVGNIYQDRYYNEALDISDDMNLLIEEENNTLENKLKIITDEYNELLEESK